MSVEEQDATDGVALGRSSKSATPVTERQKQDRTMLVMSGSAYRFAIGYAKVQGRPDAIDFAELSQTLRNLQARRPPETDAKLDIVGFDTWLNVNVTAAEIPVIALIVVVTSFSCTAFGTMIGAFGLRGRDIFFFANLMIFVFLLFCGVNIPIDTLPDWMQAVSKVLPLTHGIDAARQVADGASLGDVSGLVLTELGIGLFYAALAYALLRLFEVEGRRRASLETI